MKVFLMHLSAAIPYQLFYRQETQLLMQSLFCTDGFLRRLRRALPACPLEQPRLQVHRLALHQPIGTGLRRYKLHQSDGKRAPAAGCHDQCHQSDSDRARHLPETVAGQYRQGRGQRRHPLAGWHPSSAGRTAKRAYQEGK